jgi:hypothetical protein
MIRRLLAFGDFWTGLPERDPEIPNFDVGFCDRDGDLLSEVMARKAERLHAQRS